VKAAAVATRIHAAQQAILAEVDRLAAEAEAQIRISPEETPGFFKKPGV
jgi:hypothetical protein